MKIKDDIKIQEMFTSLKVKCSCGHTQIIPAYKDFYNCSYCGKKIANNTKFHFLYRLRKELNKNEKEK